MEDRWWELGTGTVIPFVGDPDRGEDPFEEEEDPFNDPPFNDGP